MEFDSTVVLDFSIRFYFFDSCFFRSKEPNLAMNARYKGRRKYPSHNMKIYL